MRLYKDILDLIGNTPLVRINCLTLTMPETMTIERRQIFKAFGAKVILTDGTKGIMGAVEKADELFFNLDFGYNLFEQS